MAVNLSVKSISRIPASRIRRLSFAGIFSVKEVLNVVKYTFGFSMGTLLIIVFFVVIEQYNRFPRLCKGFF